MILTGKSALITGSTSGIGIGYARALASEGAQIMLNGFGDADAITALQQEIAGLSGAPCLYSDADMRDPAAIRAMVARCEAEWGAVDILVNNAGIQHVAPVDEFPDEQYEAIMAIIMHSAFHATKAVLPGMKARRWGRIINTGSMHSTVASPYKSAYNAAKHAILGFSRTVALEVAQQGITVNTISPGYSWTPLVENQIPNTMAVRGLTREQVINDVLLAPQPTKQFVQPEQIGALALFLCREEASAITGANLAIDGGWTAQ